jgi:hypothetical protein
MLACTPFSSSAQVPGWMCARYIVPERGSPLTFSTPFTPPPLAFEKVAVPLVPEPLAGWRLTSAVLFGGAATSFLSGCPF